MYKLARFFAVCVGEHFWATQTSTKTLFLSTRKSYKVACHVLAKYPYFVSKMVAIHAVNEDILDTKMTNNKHNITTNVVFIHEERL